jgi:uncharacterized protein YbaA (DUF1428 family)
MVFERFPHLMIGPVLATLSWVILIGVLSWVLVFRTRLFHRFDEVRFDPFFCALLNIIFVFFMAFMGSEFYENHKTAAVSLVKERAAIDRLLSSNLPSDDLKQQLNAAVKAYVQNVVNVEWRDNLNRQSSQAVEQAIGDLTRLVAQARQDCAGAGMSLCIDTITTSRYLASIDELREARGFRLSLGSYEREVMRYLLCVFLALNAAICLLLVYKKDKRAALVPLVMYCLSVWVTFLIVILHAEPYVGIRGLDPGALEQVLHQLK